MKNFYITILLSAFCFPHALATEVSQDAESQLQDLISRKASVREILNLCATSRKHQTLCSKDGLWVYLIKRDFGDRALEMNKFPTAKDHYKHLYKMRAAAAHIDILEPELKALVLSKTSMRSILNFCATSHAHQKLCAAENEDLWHGLVVRDFGGIYNPKSEIFKTWKEQYVHLTKMARGTMIAASAFHGVMIDTDGHVWTFGDGALGGLGHGDTQNQAIPKMIESMKQPHVKIVSVAVGNFFTVLLDSEGNVWTFGKGEDGQLGHGDCKNQMVPKMIENLAKIVAIAAGDKHTVLLDTHGNVWTCGFNLDGRLGYASLLKPQECKPIKIETLPVKIVFVTADEKHTLLIDTEGNVWNLGDRRYNFRDPSCCPKKLWNFSAKFVAATISNAHTVLLDSEGSVWTYGSGLHGLLGHGNSEDQWVPKKIENFPAKIINAVAYDDCTLLLDNEGNVWTFGRGFPGKREGTQKEDEPRKVKMPSKKIIALATSWKKTFMIDADGKAWLYKAFSLETGPFQLQGYGNALSE